MVHGAIESALERLEHATLSAPAMQRAADVLNSRVVVGDEHKVESAFLSQIRVEGFRGVGPGRTLMIKPGPGFTLVVEQ